MIVVRFSCLGALCLSVALAACAGAPAPSAPAQSGAAQSDAAQVAIALPEPEVAPVAQPKAPARAPAGCTVTETEIDDLIHLRFELKGNSLAILRFAEARLSLDSEPRIVELERDGVMLRTPYDAAERPLHLRRALALGGVITPKPHAAIVPQGASPKGQLVRYTTSAKLGRASIDQAVACEDISLNTLDYDVHDASEPEGAYVQLSGALGVKATPSGPDALQLDLGSGIVVAELERKAGQVKIRVDTEDEVLQGWVPESAVGVAQTGVGGGGSGSGMGFGSRSVKEHIRYTACPRALALFSESESRLSEVGVVRAGTRFEIVERVERGAAAGFSEVNFWLAWIIPDSSARFMLPSAYLESCERVR